MKPGKAWSWIGVIFFGAIALQVSWALIQPIIGWVALAFLITLVLVIVVRISRVLKKGRSLR